MSSNNYYPIYDADNEIFKDHVPDDNDFINGVKCNCGCLKKSAYTNKKHFEKHLETATHKKWLEYFQCWKIIHNNEINDEKLNKQELIITYLEYEIAQLKRENAILQEKLKEKNSFLCWLMPSMSKTEHTSANSESI